MRHSGFAGGAVRNAVASVCLALVGVAMAPSAMTQTPPIEVRAGDARVAESRIATVERLTRSAVTELRQTFPGTPYRGITVVVHADEDSLPEDARRGLHPGTPGMALLGRDEIHIVLDQLGQRGPADVRTVVIHEVVHVLLDQYAGPAAHWVPRWLHEGLAQVLSGDTYLGSREEDLLYPAITDRLLRLTELREDFPDDEDLRRQAYAQAFSFVGYLERRVGLKVVVAAVKRCSDDDWYRGAFARETGYPLTDELQDWEDYLRHGSGADWRFLFNNCFAYLMIGGFVLLALAGIRRWTKDAHHRAKLEREEQLLEEESEP
jgi:hypothetical protein